MLKMRELGNNLIRLGINSSKLLAGLSKEVSESCGAILFFTVAKSRAGLEQKPRPGMNRSGRNILIGGI